MNNTLKFIAASIEPDFIIYYQLNGKRVERKEDLRIWIYIEQIFYKNVTSKTKKILQIN